MSSKTNKEQQSDEAKIRSHMALRKAVGVLGMVLPFTVWFGAYLIEKEWIQSSVSSYYHTGMRNVFVGTLWAIGVFLMFYEGYDCIDDSA